MVQPLLTLPERHSSGDKQHMPDTEDVGCLYEDHHLILRNTSKVIDTSVVVFLSLKKPRARERWRLSQMLATSLCLYAYICICAYY